MFQNVIIGNLLVDPKELFAINQVDWDENEKQNTLFTSERFLPRILVAAGAAPSINEIRRNRPDLIRELNEVGFEMIKIGKKFLWIAIGT